MTDMEFPWLEKQDFLLLSMYVLLLYTVRQLCGNNLDSWIFNLLDRSNFTSMFSIKFKIYFHSSSRYKHFPI